MKKLISVLAISLAFAGHAASAAEVIQKNKRFSTDTITIKKGEKITFSNQDPFVHNVYSQSPGMEFDIQTQQPGQSSDIKFDKTGEGEVRCAIHPTMKMKVQVTE